MSFFNLVYYVNIISEKLYELLFKVVKKIRGRYSKNHGETFCSLMRGELIVLDLMQNKCVIETNNVLILVIWMSNMVQSE